MLAPETETVATVFSTSMSRTIGAIAAALAKAQGEMKLPEKNRTVTVQTKTGGKYTFEYADLAAINAVIREPLSKNGLAYTHIMSRDEQGPHLLTMLVHSSGEWFSSRYPLPSTADPRDLGGQITYGKRYSISALIGCVADDDNDAEPDQIAQPPQARQPKPSPAPAAVLAPASSPKPQAPSTQQLGELFNQVKQSGWTTEQFKAYLSETYNLGSSRELTMDQFNQVQRDL